MRLSIEVLTNNAFTIDVYRTDLGNVDVLLATFEITQTNDTTTDPRSTNILEFDVCLPTGTYSVVFVVKYACFTSTCDQPLFNLLTFNTVDDSDVCDVYENNRWSGRNCSTLKHRNVCYDISSSFVLLLAPVKAKFLLFQKFENYITWKIRSGDCWLDTDVWVWKISRDTRRHPAEKWDCFCNWKKRNYNISIKRLYWPWSKTFKRWWSFHIFFVSKLLGILLNLSFESRVNAVLCSFC